MSDGWVIRTSHVIIDGRDHGVGIRVGGVRFSLEALDGPVRMRPFAVESETGSVRRIDVAPDRPVVVLECAGDGAPSIRLAYDGDASPDGALIRVITAAGCAVVRTDPSAVIRFDDGAVRVEPAAGVAAMRLVIAGCAEPGVDRSIEAALRDPTLVTRLGRAAIGRFERELVGIDCAVPTIGDAWRLALARLAYAPRPECARDALWQVLGALACGHHDRATALLDDLVDLADPAASFDVVLACLGHARVLAATGDVPHARSVWNRIVPGPDALYHSSGSVADGSHGAIVALALSGAAVAAETLGVGDPAGLRSAARKARVELAAAAFHEAEAALALAAAFAEPDLPLERLAAASRDDEGLALRAAARATSGHWEDFAIGLSAAEDAVLAGTTGSDRALAAFVIGTAQLVACEPDAARHRLTVRTRVPRSLTPAHVRGLRVGEARIDLAVRSTDRGWTTELNQPAGPVPVTAILEATVPAPVFDAVSVDGRPASLDAVPVGDGWILPVQLVLDAPRRVDVDLRM